MDLYLHRVCASLDLFALFTAVNHKRLGWLGLHNPTQKLYFVGGPKIIDQIEQGGAGEPKSKTTADKLDYIMIGSWHFPSSPSLQTSHNFHPKPSFPQQPKIKGPGNPTCQLLPMVTKQM
jgi:hypothetical protein